uniref:Uncharacterized protein n=1 Tax=Arundo donax TaxID=35708 RepID=A0A0A9FC93_ARUDO
MVFAMPDWQQSPSKQNLPKRVHCLLFLSISDILYCYPWHSAIHFPLPPLLQ